MRVKTSPNLWPTGSSEVSPPIAARSFSSCLLDSPSRRTPLPSLSGRALDRIIEHKEALEEHLSQRWKDLFGATFDVLL